MKLCDYDKWTWLSNNSSWTARSSWGHSGIQKAITSGNCSYTASTSGSASNIIVLRNSTQNLTAGGSTPSLATPPKSPHGFNAFLNASDLLEDFALYAKAHGMGRKEFMDLPLKLFVQFLILKAAEADGVDPPEDVGPVVKIPKQSHCRWCGRFLSNVFRQNKIDYCSEEHFSRKLARARSTPLKTLSLSVPLPASAT